MDHQLFASLPPQERRRVLSDNCDRVEEIGYMKAFGPDEMAVMKDDLATVSIDIDQTEKQKKDAVAEFADSLKSLNKRRKTLLKSLHNKAERVSETCYAFFDHDHRMVGFYNAEGVLVSSRTMRPEEYQKSVFNVNRTIEPNKTGTTD